MKGSPNELAMGLASGLSISFTPFIGLHSLLAILFSWVIGGSMAASIIGTFFGNPWNQSFFETILLSLVPSLEGAVHVKQNQN